jgi:hypothetical protein
MTRAVRLAMALLLWGSLVSCDVREYCLECSDYGAGVDGGLVDGVTTGDGGPTVGDGGDDGPCVYLGSEICNGRDDDCNGQVDEGVLPGTGESCGSSVGACRPGTTECLGGQVVCGHGAVNPKAELCNGLDDDCDGQTDEGDPEGGQPCGAPNQGDCRAGVSRCAGGALVCDGALGPQPEVCDGRDNDCDGVVDNGNPGGGAACGIAIGECRPGTVTCVGGHLVCQGQTGPQPELCDGKDNDCNGLTDEGIDTTSDPRNCGGCGISCVVPHASAACHDSHCAIVGCLPGYYNLNGTYDDGCEYPCDYQGQEICNGADDDCNGETDEGLAPPPVCLTEGECAGTVAVCLGPAGWQCPYPATVTLDVNGDIIAETDCDDRDNDCNGITDDAQGQHGAFCSNGTGVCMQTGHMVCNSTHDGLVCDAPAALQPPRSDELCNGKDDNCDGQTDESAKDSWMGVAMGNGTPFWIQQFEASHPDATPAAAGTMTTRACSNPGVQPWTDVSHGQAAAACSAAGGRLCREDEWQRACETANAGCAGTIASPSWSFRTNCKTWVGTTCNGNDYNPGNDQLKATGTLPGCYSPWGTADGGVFDLSGNAKEWTKERATGVNPLRGGTYDDTQLGISCQWNFVVADDAFKFVNVGFRCCRDTAPP